MTAHPSPPNRRRRKLIVVCALVLVSLISWRFWPRVVGVAPEQSLRELIVGKWHRGHASEFEPREHPVEVEFLEDGTGFETRNGFKRFRFRWSIEPQNVVRQDYAVPPANEGELEWFGSAKQRVSRIDREQLVWTLLEGTDGPEAAYGSTETLERTP